MSAAKNIYNAFVGHTHERAVEEVYAAGYALGKSDGIAETIKVYDKPAPEASVELGKKETTDETGGGEP